MEHILSKLSRRYPQLLFPISSGVSKTPEYRDAVCLGKAYNGSLDYSLSEKDQLICVDTPAGVAEVLLLYNRKDFEKCFCALANRCEPKIIPQSVGACMISGLINWEKAHHYLEKYKICKEMDEILGLNFLKLLNCDFKDRIILLSSGWYSGVAPEMVGLSNEEWIDKSIIIRMYHEVTHFVCRTLYPNDIDVIRDEIFADMIGMVAAFGYYDIHMAKLFLGIDSTGVRENGRIKYYIEHREMSVVLEEANMWISWFHREIKNTMDDINNMIVPVFEELRSVNKSKVGV